MPWAAKPVAERLHKHTYIQHALMFGRCVRWKKRKKWSSFSLPHTLLYLNNVMFAHFALPNNVIFSTMHHPHPRTNTRNFELHHSKNSCWITTIFGTKDTHNVMPNEIIFKILRRFCHNIKQSFEFILSSFSIKNLQQKKTRLNRLCVLHWRCVSRCVQLRFLNRSTWCLSNTSLWSWEYEMWDVWRFKCVRRRASHSHSIRHSH